MNTNDNDATQLQNNNDITKLPTDDDATQLSICDESTRLNDRATIDKQGTANTAKPTPSSTTTKETGKMAKKAGIYAAGGILLGGASALYADMNGNNHAAMAEVTTPGDTEIQEGISLSDVNSEGAEAVADNIANDDVTFDEAFANARAEFGPGSSFAWKGNVYATYTKEEWDGMTDDEKTDFYQQINIPNPDSEAEMSVVADAHLEESSFVQENETLQEEPTDNPELTAVSEPTEETTPLGEVTATDTSLEELPEIEGINIVTVEAPEPEIGMDAEIQILGVENVPEMEANIGTLNIDGQEVFVVDVDGDMVFDTMAVDMNQDGMIDDDEIFNIQDYGLTVEGLGGYTDSGDLDPMGNPDSMGNDMYASNDEGPDYMSEFMNEC